MIKKFGCIEIPVSNMKNAINFYQNVLGLKKTYEHPVWTSFDVGGVNFAVGLSGTKKSDKPSDICTSCSMCVLKYAAAMMKLEKDVPSATSVIYMAVESLDEFHKKLKDQGVKFLSEPKDQGWGGRAAVMLDPDNNIIVLTQE